MVMLQRLKNNPIVAPDSKNSWEISGAFNPTVVKNKNEFYLLYRAESALQEHGGYNLKLSSLAYTKSKDGINFSEHMQLNFAQNAWDFFGREDPRVTFLDHKYYIFYTALSEYPFTAEGIKVAVAITNDFVNFKAHPVTSFNAKAMALFPEKINNKFVAVLTAHTDTPPAKIVLAEFDKEDDIWAAKYWQNWQQDINSHVLPLHKSTNDHLEVGAVPIKTKAGWLLIYSYIQNYFSTNKIFTVNAALLDLKNPAKILGVVENILMPEKDYELRGNVANIVFPSGAIVNDDELLVYYGAADTTCCVATCKLAGLLTALTKKSKISFLKSKNIKNGFARFNDNPIIAPRLEFAWELKGTLNPAAFYENGVHIIYRAFSQDETSTLGYAFSKDGVHIDERPANPIYLPREDFEKKQHSGFSGCEDPRITRINDKLYMLYTAYNGEIPRVALTAIMVNDFLMRNWQWEKPRIISAPDVKDKNSCLFPRKINGEYIILHRANRNIYIDFVS